MNHLFISLNSHMRVTKFSCNIALIGFRRIFLRNRFSEAATFSLFVLSGKSLRATVEISGPVADAAVVSGMALQDGIDAFDQGRRPKGSLDVSGEVDFEHLNLGEPEFEDPVLESVPGETAEERKTRRAEERRKILEARHQKEMHARKQKKKVQTEAEPYLRTIQAPLAGWYRFCVKASFNQITAEIDLRKESELGGLDEDGHVMTNQQRIMEEEEKAMDQDTAAIEGIKDKDFQATRTQLKELRKLLNDIQTKQSQERLRLAVHAATNEHSHSRMALNSLMETILFMLVTGYQVYTIRRWFKGAPVLGR
jgi:hypothetical protein